MAAREKKSKPDCNREGSLAAASYAHSQRRWPMMNGESVSRSSGNQYLTPPRLTSLLAIALAIHSSKEVRKEGHGADHDDFTNGDASVQSDCGYLQSIGPRRHKRRDA